jgi:hypothetical protein
MTRLLRGFLAAALMLAASAAFWFGLVTIGEVLCAGAVLVTVL